MTSLHRRDFGRVGAAGMLTALSAGRVLGANERIRLGFIGLGNRGDQVLDGFLVHKDCEVVAVCDIWQPYLDFAAKKAGTTDPKKVMETIKAGSWDTVIGKLEYDAKGDIKQLDYVVYKWDASGNYAELNPKGS